MDQQNDDANDLSVLDKLDRRERAMNPDGSVDVEILGWEGTGDDHVTVEFLTPSNDVKQETMEVPSVGEDFYEAKFYRLLDSVDLEIGHADLLEGETIPAWKRTTGWTLAPDAGDRPSYRERLSNRVQDEVFREYLRIAIFAAGLFVWAYLVVVVA